MNQKPPEVCSHLQPLLHAAIPQGATVKAVETGWTAVDLVVVLTKGFTPQFAVSECNDHNVEFWECNDAHYSIEYGFVCKTHRQCLSWPQDSASMNSI